MAVINKILKQPPVYLAFAAALFFAALWHYNFFAGIPDGFPRSLVREGRISITSAWEKEGAVFVAYDSRRKPEKAVSAYEKYFFAGNGYETVKDIGGASEGENLFQYLKFFRKDDKQVSVKIESFEGRVMVELGYGPAPESGVAAIPASFTQKELLPNNSFVLSANEYPPLEGSPTHSISLTAEDNILNLKNYYINRLNAEGWVISNTREGRSITGLDPNSEAGEVSFIWIRAEKDKNVFVANIEKVDENTSALSILYGI